MSNEKLAQHAYTLSHTGLVNVLVSDIEITKRDEDKSIAFFEGKGLWDTGATNTLITQKVVDKLGLKQTGTAYVNTANESAVLTSTYTIDIFIKGMDKRIPVIVTLGKVSDSIDCLIGMDVICLGDFTITHHKGLTVMTYRIPSLHCLDYVKEHHMANRFSGNGFRQAKRK